jgi:hypothetical protein
VLKTFLIHYLSLFRMSSPSEQIAAHPFFTADVSALPFDERIALAYQRAILILRTYSMIPAVPRLYTLVDALGRRLDG